MSLPIAQGVLGIESFTPPWDVFYLPLFNGLIGLYQLLFSDLALGIIVFTIVIRTILAPLFVRQIRSQRETQRVQPLLREVQRKYRGDRQKIGAETMAIYKEHGVNPAAGCLPVLLQLPILFALYQALIRASSVINFNPSGEEQQARLDEFLADNPAIEPLPSNNYQIEFSGPCDVPPEFSNFLPLNCQLIDPLKLTEPVDTTIGWLGGLNLADIDRVFAVAPFGFTLSALAVLAAVLQFVQVKMTMTTGGSDDPAAQATNMMIYLFPLMTIVWGAIFPSGLLLYWVVYTAYLIVQQYTLMGWGNLFPLFGWAPAFARSATGLAGAAPAASSPRRGEAGPTFRPTRTEPTVPAAARASSRKGRTTQKRRRGREARKR